MNKFYIDHIPVFLATNPLSTGAGLSKTHLELTYHSLEELGEIIKYIRAEIKNLQAVTISHPDFNKLQGDILTYYKFVEAAGGAVFNASNELLMIHRLDKWDLPKGKLDPGETTQQAALREVTEETAITNLTIVEPVNLPHTGAYTYHTFVDHNGKRMLKRTAWYVMRCPGHPIGKPQTSEGISEIKWIPQSEIQTTTTNSYPTIIDVVQSAVLLNMAKIA